MRRGAGRGGKPTIHAQMIRAGATTAFSLLSKPSTSAAPLNVTSCRTTAAYTARHTPAAAINSPRPKTFATALGSWWPPPAGVSGSEEHTSELQSQSKIGFRLLILKKKKE